MSIELTSADPIAILLGLAFAFWMHRRPAFFARLCSLGWFKGILIGGANEHWRRDPPQWSISLFLWLGLIGILGALADLGIYIALVATGHHVY